MQITRDDVLQAIEKEPLIAGDWVERRGIEIDKPCAVCAVGAVLRNKGIDDIGIPIAAHHVTRGVYNCHDASLPVLLRDKLYISALSVKWERLVDQIKPSEWFTFKPEDLERLKPLLRDWVLENFPDGVLYEEKA